MALRSSLQPWIRRVATAHATTRALIGVTSFAAPGLAGRWMGPAVLEGGGRVALRAFGIREVVIGTGILHSLAKGDPVRRWFALGLALEVVDSAATMADRRHLPDGPVPGAVALFGASGLVGGALVALLLDE